TTLRFIGLCFARVEQNWHRERLGVEEPLVPVLLRLADLHADLGKQPPLRQNIIDEVASRLQCNEQIAEQLVDGWMEESLLLVLLDGLDEVPEARREGVREAIERFAHSDRGRVIVTSRLAGFRPLTGFREYVLKPLEDVQTEVLPYVRGWLAAIGQDQDVEQRAQELVRALEEHPSLRRIANNPLLLRLAVEYYVKSKGGRLPSGRAELYEKWLEEAWKRAEERGASEERKELIFMALEAIAWGMQIGKDSDDQGIEKAIKEFAGISDKHTIEEVLRDIWKRMGLIARLPAARGDPSQAHYVFAHETVREYLVARRLLRAWEQDWEQTMAFLEPRLFLPEWEEPLALLVDLLSKLSKPKEPKLVGLSLKRLEELEEKDLREEIRRFVRAIECAGPESDVPLLRARALELLSEGGHELEDIARCLLKELLADPRLSVRARAIRVVRQSRWWWAAEDARRLLEDQDEDTMVRQAAAEALGELGDPQALPVLFRAQNDDDPRVREAAAEALGKLCNPRAVPMLLQALQEDDDPGVRRAAAEALGELGDPQAVPSLLQALQDVDPGMRRAAAEALGKLGDPQALPPLLQALQDEDPMVRQAAARAL
ncbi:MAG: HEAT repeat domain-containing protein, partial [Thermoflexus sp.]|uniref:HEAT repeat domain-containing protein n=1 Tax=Thermoflexus sp. TaxID=1969742 RepID=UPI0025EE52FF